MVYPVITKTNIFCIYIFYGKLIIGKRNIYISSLEQKKSYVVTSPMSVSMVCSHFQKCFKSDFTKLSHKTENNKRELRERKTS